MPRFISLVVVASSLALAGCADEGAGAAARGEGPALDEPLGETSAASRARTVADFEVVVPWGDGPEAVGRRAPTTEFLGDGPSGIAVGPRGDVVVVDRMNRRLVSVDGDGSAPLFAVPEDGEHLALGPDGVAVLYSPYRARVWLHAPDGASLGELAVPRLLGDVGRVALGPSRRVELTTAFQERFTIGGASAPLPDADVLRSKREGALAPSADGPALVAQRTEDGHATLRAVKEGSRTSELVVDLGEAAAVRLLGRHGDLVVSIVEEVKQPGEALVVTRHLVVVDTRSRAVAARRALPRGAWVPREAVALGGSPPVVAFMAPEVEGLRVARLDVTRLAAEGGVK